jgi:hypothetical protein
MHINQHDWFYKILDVPALPTELEDLLWTRYHSPDLDQYKYTSDHYLNRRPEFAHKPGPGDVVGLRHGQEFPNGRGARYQLDSIFDDWVIEHITNDFIDTGIYVIFGDRYHTVIPHTDQTRNFSLLYLLEPGGDNTHTDFWIEHGQSIHREMKTFQGDYSRLTPCLSVKWPLRTWILLNTNILHSVEELSSPRIQFQVSLDRIPDTPVKFSKDL